MVVRIVPPRSFDPRCVDRGIKIDLRVPGATQAHAGLPARYAKIIGIRRRYNVFFKARRRFCCGGIRRGERPGAWMSPGHLVPPVGRRRSSLFQIGESLKKRWSNLACRAHHREKCEGALGVESMMNAQQSFSRDIQALFNSGDGRTGGPKSPVQTPTHVLKSDADRVRYDDARVIGLKQIEERNR